jgi:hypothetical protein
VTLHPGSASFYGPELCAAAAKDARWKASIARAVAHEECWNR